ncbi:MAG: hypothetical protein WC736_15345 [Gallionella sp.]|jgi:hypothetical protein
MSLPNATALLRTLPTGMRATVSRGSEVASLAVRTAIQDSGTLSLSGLECDLKTVVWTLDEDFDPAIRIGDVLTVDDVPAFVVNAMTTCGNLVNRAQVVLCTDSVTVNDVAVPCHLGMLSQDVAASLGGFLPDDLQGFFAPLSTIPEGVEITVSTPVEISGEAFVVEKISRDSRHGILCVTCHRRGDA